MPKHFCLLWLEAPLQSWGVDSKFGRRESLNFPSKSGVLGLVLCAMGKSGPQIDLLKDLSSGAFSVISYKNPANSFGETRLCDFHMVGSAYDDKDPWFKMHIPKTSEGKAAVGGGTKLTYRYYLQDAKFAVIIEVDNDLCKDIETAFNCPVFDIYFGRKSCVPTDKIFRGCYSSYSEAQNAANRIALEKKLEEKFKVIEGEHEGDIMVLADVPVQFGTRKKYKERIVTLLS